MAAELIKVDKALFENLNFKIEVSPFGKQKCCCGFLDCTDLDCLITSSKNQSTMV